MKSLDQIFTPTTLADYMVSKVELTSISFIADFTVGDGILLDVALLKWPNSKILANDIDPSIISELAINKPSWTLTNYDILSIDFKNNMKPYINMIDLILLNPPFSSKGSARIKLEISNIIIECSLSLACIISSLNYISLTGQMIAIVPKSSFLSIKDKGAWRYLASLYEISEYETFDRKTFKGYAASIKVIKIIKRRIANIIIEEDGNQNCNSEFRIRRGSFQMFRFDSFFDPNGFFLIHSTNLRDNQLLFESNRRVKRSQADVFGLVILIPRVGNPSINKIVLTHIDRPSCLSDCVIAIYGASEEMTINIYSILVRNWGIISEQYHATCAPYITIAQLKAILTKLLSSGCP